MAQKQNAGNAANILVGASPLFLSVEDSSVNEYNQNMIPNGSADVDFTANRNTYLPKFDDAKSFRTTLNDVDTLKGASQSLSGVKIGGAYRNVGYTNNGLQITYNPTYENVTVDQLLDSAKVFKSAMEVMIATEMSEGTLENVLAVFGQKSDTLARTDATNATLGLAAGALGSAPIERQLIAVGNAPTTDAEKNTERVYYARRVLSVQQSQFSLARNTPTTFPVTFRLLPSGDSAYEGQEYGVIVDRSWTPA